MDTLEIKLKKEKVKEMAKNSILFSSSEEALETLIKGVDMITEDEQGNNELDELIQKFKTEKESVINSVQSFLQI